LIVADRMVLLDHLTRGRIMLGVGPGSLPSDAWMMGIEPIRQREMMEESLEAILALLRSDEPVQRETSWFRLRDARLQLRPYTRPHFEVGVAATVSPAGPRAAGRFGCSLLSLSATSQAGFDVLGQHWKVMQERAAEFGTNADRGAWRLVGPMHLAETEEQARRDVRFGLVDWIEYFRKVAALPLDSQGNDSDSMVDALHASRMAVIGTPEMAIAQIRRLVEQSGGFGTFLLLAHEWADRAATLKSFELFARQVMPAFQGSLTSLTTSRDWVAGHRDQLLQGAAAAIGKAVTQHFAEKEAKTSGKA
jgi:limonene 1,2-monooxygenase